MSILDSDFRKRANKYLSKVDETLTNKFAGDFGGRQPVHTCYVPADKFQKDVVNIWKSAALDSLNQNADSPDLFAQALGLEPEVVSSWWDRLKLKLNSEPIEDLRIDFEDGYGRRGDEEEEEHIAQVLSEISSDITPFLGIRIKSFEAVTRDRALKTLDQFISGMSKKGILSSNFIITLPKVTFADQVEVMVDACKELEKNLKLPAKFIKFEIQIETTQAIIGPNGKVSAAEFINSADGRLTGFHYGTYDYSASAGVSAAYQTLDHPAADFAKSFLQVTAAGTGIRLSDGSTNIIPIGSLQEVHHAWANHYRLVRRQLERGFYQGWDLHGTQLPTRFAANFTFYREGLAAASQRIRTYLDRAESGTMDEPATALALANYFLRGLDAGAVSDHEINELTGENEESLRALVRRRGQIQ